MKRARRGPLQVLPRDIGVAEGFSSKMEGAIQQRRRLWLSAAVAPVLALVMVASGVAALALDPGFGDGGASETPMPAEERQLIFELGQGPLVSDLAVAPRGGLVAAVGSGTENEFFGAASFRADGTLDNRFGGDGFIRAGIFPALVRYVEPQATGVAVQRDGKIVLVGYRSGVASDTPAPVVMRLHPNGAPDRSFGEGGLVAPRPHGGRADVLHAVDIQPGGRIIAVGARNERDRKAIQVKRPAGLVVAYRPDGRVDSSFGEGGRVFFPGRKARYAYTGLLDVSVLANGEILVVGYRSDRLLVARLKTNGELDRSFGDGDGMVSIGLGRGALCCPEQASVFSLKDGGSVVLTDGFSPVLMARLRQDGRLNRRFGKGGIARQNRSASTEMHDVAVQGDGRIVAVGVDVRGGRLVFVTLRFLPDGRRDRSFGNRGVMSLPLGRSSFGTSAVTLPNGQVVAGGGAQYRRNDRLEYSLLLARLPR